MINLNDLNEEREVKIFNNGAAGRVKNVRLEITKKTPEEKENAPDFKFNYFDAEDGTINDGFYYPKSEDTEKNKQITLSRLISVLHSIYPESKDKLLPEFDEYKPAIDYLIKQVAQYSRTGRFNLFVNYGTKNKPSQYLRVRKFNFIEALDVDGNSTRLTAKTSANPDKSQWDDMLARLEPTKFDEDSKPAKENTLDDW